MTMLAEMKFTEARNQFTSVIDRVQSLSPVVIKPRKQSESPTFLMNEALVQKLLQGVKFEVKILQEEDGSITLGLDELELFVNGDSASPTSRSGTYVEPSITRDAVVSSTSSPL